MKKAISFFLIVSMLLSCVVFALPASALATAENIDYVEALYFETAPTIDGYISEEEWGEYNVFVEAWDCATVDDTTPYYNFFYNRISATNRDDYDNFSYYIWLRWDLNKFYIGVEVNDPDGHSLKNGTTNTWNGDAVQTRIDKNGANAVVNGGEFTVTADRQRPWSTTSVPDFLFGYVEIAGGFSEAWENTTNKGMTSFSNNPMGVTQCVVAPAGSSYSSDTQAGITTYEIAIPWSYIYNGDYESLEMKQYAAGRDTATKGPRGAIGKELGMSLVVMNDGADATGGWDAFMSWGSGICQAHHQEGAAACSGSNSVVLVETPVSQTAGYQTYDPTPLLDAKFTTNHLAPVDTYYDYLAGDTALTRPVSYEELSALTYDDEADLSVWGAPEYGGSIGTAISSSGSYSNVLDYRDPAISQSYIDTRDGTTQYLFPTSYTFEFDIMYTGVEQFAEGYGSELYNWFGGPTCYAYQCGYFFNDSAFKIVKTYDLNEVLASYPYDLKKNTWYNWKFQYDNNSCNARLWIDDLSTEADNVVGGTEGTPGYTGEWGTLVINANWRYFYYSSEMALTEGTLLLFRQMNVQTMYDNVKIYNFASASNCLHTNVTEEITPPTCTENGWRRSVCADCGEYLNVGSAIPPLGHLEPTLVGDCEATCTEDGYTGNYVCPRCNEVSSYGDVIPAKGHTVMNGKCAVCREDVADEQGIKYNITNGEAIITGYQGSNTVLELPEEIEGYPVTTIATRAFDCNEDITKVILPDTVSVIEEGAFGYCTNLREVILSSSLTTIGESAFEYCRALTYVNIPESVTSIGDYAFCCCLNLSEISFYGNLREIGSYAFDLCESLTTVYYSESAENFGNISMGTGNEYLLNTDILYDTTKFVAGDLNGDGQVSGIDSNIIKRIILGMISVDADSELYLNADINGDGFVNSRDSNLIKRLISGWGID